MSESQALAAMTVADLRKYAKDNGITLTALTTKAAILERIGEALKEAGISIVETKVGDRYVLESMLANGYSIGGEQSGHIILLSKNTTGDGMMSALSLLGVVAETKKRLSKLAARIPQYPQVLVNVIVENDVKAASLADDELSALTKEIEDKLGKNGRVLIRASGTEPLVRIMIEGQDEQSILEQVLSLAHIIVRKYNGKIRT